MDLLRALFFTGVPEMDDGGVLLDPMLLSLNASSLQKIKRDTNVIMELMLHEGM